MITLIETLEKRSDELSKEARNARVTGDGNPAYYEAQVDGIGAAIAVVKKFVADNADCIDAQPALLIEKITGDK